MRCRVFILFFTLTVTRADHFSATWDDGTHLTGQVITNTYGWARMADQVPSVGPHPVHRAGTRVRYIRDHRLEVHRAGPFVQFANGDILPASVDGLVIPNPDAGIAEHRLVLRLSPPLKSYGEEPELLQVRLKRVVRIATGVNGQDELAPGTLVLRSGDILPVKALRWGDHEFRALTAAGIRTIPFQELLAYRAASIDVWTAMREDLSVPCPDPDSPLVRFRITNGGELTTRRALYVEMPNDEIGIQPAWSYGGIRMSTRSHVVSRSYRAGNEIPLSLMPVSSLKQESYTGFIWPWRLDRNVRGGELVTGDFESAFGFGTHAYSELAVDLPEGARSFNAWVGIDRSVGQGGCVECRIYGDKPEGRPLWRSGFLRGGDAAKRAGPLGVGNLKRLVLVTDYGHRGRPAGSDPMDIRDVTDWMEPLVTIDALPPAEFHTPAPALLAELEPWSAPDAITAAPAGPAWVHWWNQWNPGVYADAGQELRISRTITVTPATAWLQLGAGRSRTGRGGHTISVEVNGSEIPSVGRVERVEEAWLHRWQNLSTTNQTAGAMHIEDWDFGAFAGKDIRIDLVIRPAPVAGHPLPKLVFERARLRSMIRPDDHSLPRSPDIPLSRVEAMLIDSPDEAATLLPGKQTNGEPLRVYGYPFDEGYGVPAGTKIMYRLQPEWKRFVAVIGTTRAGGEAVGPFRLRLDASDEVLWESDRFHWNRLGWQIDVEIPPGHDTLALEVGDGREGYGAWAQAGFMISEKPE